MFARVPPFRSGTLLAPTEKLPRGMRTPARQEGERERLSEGSGSYSKLEIYEWLGFEIPEEQDANDERIVPSIAQRLRPSVENVVRPTFGLPILHRLH